jgi:glycine cleavage system H protein
MHFPTDLKYTESHEWVRVDGNVATVGISWFAQDSMGDVVHVEPAEVGTNVDKGSPVCEIESVKAVSDVYSPLSGEITAVNASLEDTPEAINDAPYVGGWLFKVTMSDVAQVEAMMDAATYQAHCEA